MRCDSAPAAVCDDANDSGVPGPWSVTDAFDPTAHNPSFSTVCNAVPDHDEIIDFCVPVNAYFPTSGMLERLKERLPHVLKHDPDYADIHEQRIASLIGVAPENVVVANGATEIITALCRTERGPTVMTVPTFGRWTDLPPQAATSLHFVHHHESHIWKIHIDELIAQVHQSRATSLVICNRTTRPAHGFQIRTSFAW